MTLNSFEFTIPITDDEAEENVTGIIITATVVITGCLIVAIIAITVLIVILHRRKRKEINYHVRAHHEPIYDDLDSPHYDTCEDMKQVPIKKTSQQRCHSRNSQR